jgi:hypothetical protein
MQTGASQQAAADQSMQGGLGARLRALADADVARAKNDPILAELNDMTQEQLRDAIDAVGPSIAYNGARHPPVAPEVYQREVLEGRAVFGAEIDPTIRLLEEVSKRANRLADECGNLRHERDELLRENAILRRKLERAKR